MTGGETCRSRRLAGVDVRVVFFVATALLLSACGWFGSKDEKPAAAVSQTPSEEILRKDCTDEQWKQQNLGLWYSVCRQPMRW